jgi:peptidylprolyl isomerase
MNRFFFAVFIAFVFVVPLNSIRATELPEHLQKPAAGVVAVQPGLAFKILVAGAGAKTTDPYKVIRTRSNTWKADGTQTGSTEDGLSTTQLRRVRESLPFFATILESMPVGETRRWWISSELVPEGSRAFEKADYVMDIEIVDVLDPLPAPQDVAEIPKAAVVTSQGIGIMLLRAGDQTNFPELDSTIVVHYSGWTSDGRMFDSTRLREAPASFLLNRLITGWQLAIPKLSKGEIARIWIPGALAYDNREDRPFSPKGMLVFDVELIDME